MKLYAFLPSTRVLAIMALKDGDTVGPAASERDQP